VAVVLIAATVALLISDAGAIMAAQSFEPPLDVQGAYSRHQSKLEQATDAYARWVALAPAAMASAGVDKLDQADAYAGEALALLPSYAKDWNYGNVVYGAHAALGRTALRRGDVAEAMRQLALAGKSPGSPQLDSFGPNLSLARELRLTRDPGARDAVLAHFNDVEKFWKMDLGSLRVWRADVRDGRVPNFHSSLLLY